MSNAEKTVFSIVLYLVLYGKLVSSLKNVIAMSQEYLLAIWTSLAMSVPLNYVTFKFIKIFLWLQQVARTFGYEVRNSLISGFWKYFSTLLSFQLDTHTFSTKLPSKVQPKKVIQCS